LRYIDGENSWRRGVSIGETLADARGQAGLTITQVSQQTRIRESIIRSIEQGDFSPCGGDFYARGHIRSIAGVVGTDPGPLIREYDAEHGPPGSMSAADVFEPATPIRIRESRRSFGLAKVMIVVLLAVIGYGAYYFVTTRTAATPTAAAVRHSASPKPTVKATPTTSPTAASQRSRPEAVIRLAAVKNCWVVLTANGKPLYTGIVQAGQTKIWRERQVVSMTLGNPGGVVLTVNGVRQTPNPGAVVTLSISPSKAPASPGSPASASPGATSASPEATSASREATGAPPGVNGASPAATGAPPGVNGASPAATGAPPGVNGASPGANGR
jgi:cytoskeletal protein RodZ